MWVALLELAEDPERRFVEFAKRQPEYVTLPAFGRVMTEWSLIEEERIKLIRDANLRLWIWTFGQPLQPVMLEVTSEEQP